MSDILRQGRDVCSDQQNERLPDSGMLNLSRVRLNIYHTTSMHRTIILAISLMAWLQSSLQME
jgi:hypothetical protein